MDTTEVIYGIVKGTGQKGITLAAIKALPQTKGLHAHSALAQLIRDERIKTFSLENKLHYVTNTADEKMFYTSSEAASFLHIKEDVFTQWVNRLHIETRSLPHTKGVFIAKRDVLLIQENIKHPHVLL